MKKSTIAVLVIILISIAVGIYFYPKMPSKMASHWNINGEVNGYMPRFWALFMMPIISVVMFLMFIIIPKIDPLKKNVKKFRKYFDAFIVLMIVFLMYLHFLTLAWNLGYKFSMNLMIPPAIGILFYYCGILIEKSKRNWFIGIRTPWTLSSDIIWNKTHKLGSKLFKLAGIITFLSIIIPKYSFWIMIITILAASFWPVIYSYVIYQKSKKKRR